MTRRALATLLLTVVFYGTLLCSVLTEAAFWEHAFGPTVWGLPAPGFVALVVTLVFLPVPWFLWHAVEIARRGREHGLPGGGFGLLFTLFTIGRHSPDLRRSQAVAVGGLLYALAAMAAWIWYATVRGL